MFRRVAGSIAANPLIYDLIQKAVGVDIVNRRLAHVIQMDAPGLIVDVGAGTGLDAGLRAPVSRYLALDVDIAKLRRLRKKQPGAAAVLGDGAALPVRDASADLVLVKAVIHHLDDAELSAFFAEAARVLRPSGRLIISDPVWSPGRWPGRLLWAGDRGSHPRSADELRLALERLFAVRTWQTYAIFHRYVLAVALPLPQEASDVVGGARPW